MNIAPPSSAVDALRRDVTHTLVEMRKRIEAVETTLAALAPLQDSDRMELARVCQATGVSLKEIDRREASADRARKVNCVFRTLRERGWSFDRVAKATGYTARGVASNLEKFTQSAVQETGHANGLKTPTPTDKLVAEC
jgi:predicted phage gp36 major capsid-like protein